MKGHVKVGAIQTEDGKWHSAINIKTKQGQDLEYISMFAVATEDEAREVAMYVWGIFDAKKSGFKYDRNGLIED